MSPCQAAWYDAQTGSGGLKCAVNDAEGTLVVDAPGKAVTIKVQGRDAVGLRGLLCGCLRTAVGNFPGVKITKERVVCGVCEEETSTRALRRKIMSGGLEILCAVCDTRLPIEDLLPGTLHASASHGAAAAADNYKLLCEWIKTPEKAKAEGKFLPGQQMVWRQLLSTYLRSFVPAAIHSEDSPPLLWLPQLSPTGCASLNARFAFHLCT